MIGRVLVRLRRHACRHAATATATIHGPGRLRRTRLCRRCGRRWRSTVSVPPIGGAGEAKEGDAMRKGTTMGKETMMAGPEGGAVLGLGRAWAAVLAEETETWAAYVASAGGPEEDDLLRRLDAAGERREALEDAIRDTPARTVEEVAVKLEVARRWAVQDGEMSAEGRFACAALADLERLLGDSCAR